MAWPHVQWVEDMQPGSLCPAHWEDDGACPPPGRKGKGCEREATIKNVLLRMAHRAHDGDDGHMWIGVPRLATATAWNESTIKRARAALLNDLEVIAVDTRPPKGYRGAKNRQPRNFALRMRTTRSWGRAWRPRGKKGAELLLDRFEKLVADVGYEGRSGKYDHLLRDTFNGYGLHQMWLVPADDFEHQLDRWEADKDDFYWDAADGAEDDQRHRWESLINSTPHPDWFGPLLNARFGTACLDDVAPERFEVALSQWEKSPTDLIWEAEWERAPDAPAEGDE